MYNLTVQNEALTLAGTLNRLSLSELHTKHRISPSLPVRRNLLIKLNCAEMELANSLILAQTCRAGSRVNKDEQYSGSSEYKHCLGSVVIQHGCNNENQQVITCSQLSRVALVKLNQQVTGKEKGSAENTTLEMVPLLIHEENQRSPALDCKIKHDSSNLRNEINQHLADQHVRTCETFVGQPSGASLAFLRWRRLISVSIEAAINCPVLSPSSFTNSIPWTISCGIRAAKVCDFALVAFVAITVTPMVRCSTVCTKKYESKCLTCSTLKNRLVFNTLILSVCENSEARKCVTTSRASIHNVNEAYTMEYSHSTPTRFKFLFLAVCRSDLNAKPHRESVTAHSEQDARRSLAGQFVLSFAGRLPEVNHA